MIKSGNAIAGDDQEMTIIHGVNVTDLSLAQEREMNCWVHHLPPFRQKKAALRSNGAQRGLIFFPHPSATAKGSFKLSGAHNLRPFLKKASSRLSRTGHKHLLQET